MGGAFKGGKHYLHPRCKHKGGQGLIPPGFRALSRGGHASYYYASIVSPPPPPPPPPHDDLVNTNTRRHYSSTVR